MWWNLLRAVIGGVVIVAVSELARRHPRIGALILSLPQVSILAFLFAWHQHGELPTIERLARETLILVPLGLPFFLPLAFAGKLGLNFWTAFMLGLLLAGVCIGLWMWLGPKV